MVQFDSHDRRAPLRRMEGLPLRHHGLGMFKTLAPYLYDRTSGSIGSLSRLITGAAIERESLRVMLWPIMTG